jgi:hypothetical protein
MLRTEKSVKKKREIIKRDLEKENEKAKEKLSEIIKRTKEETNLGKHVERGREK